MSSGGSARVRIGLVGYGRGGRFFHAPLIEQASDCALARHGTMRLSELSDRLQIAPRTATEVVDALQARDLVRRRADPGDRRAIQVEVTERGSGVLAEIRATRGAEAGRTFGRLSPGERAELARILSKLRN